MKLIFIPFVHKLRYSIRVMKIRSFLCAALSTALTAFSFLPVQAEETDTAQTSAPAPLSDQVQNLIAQDGLNETSFAVLYYNTVTGESYEYNPDTALFCASIYKLPLNMLCYDREREGTLSPDTTIYGYNLTDAHYQSIVMSNNEVSDAMIYTLGSYADFKRNVAISYGGERYGNPDNLDSKVYIENDFPAGLMMSALKYLWDNQSQYQTLLSLMCAPEQRNGFEQNLPDGVQIYQKQGWYPQTNTVCEIVMDEQPYLCVIMVNNRDDSADVITAANLLVYNYHTQTEAAVKAQQEAEAAAAQASAEAEEAKAQASASAEAELEEETAEKESSTNAADVIGVAVIAILTAISVGVIIKQAASK